MLFSRDGAGRQMLRALGKDAKPKPNGLEQHGSSVGLSELETTATSFLTGSINSLFLKITKYLTSNNLGVLRLFLP